MIDAPLISARLRTVLASLRQDLKPDLSAANSRLRADLIDAVLSRLAAEIETGGDAQVPSPGLATPATPPAIAWVAASENRRRAAFEAKVIEAAAAPPSGRASSQELAISAEAFTAYLRARFADQPQIGAAALTTVPGGRSKGTILVDLVDGGALVLRRDFEVSLTGSSVAYEYPIVKAVFEAGLPAPEPLWLENDATSPAGRFIAFRKVEGRAMGTLFETSASPGLVRAFAAALAGLHQLDISASGLDAQLRWGGAGGPVRAMLEDFYQRYRADVTPVPIMDAAFAWLFLQVDDIGVQRSLVHGDAGLHNVMGEGDRLTGLLDWEFAHVGDPAEDLTYCKHLVQTVIPWGAFMEAYQEAGGLPPSEARMRFFTVWRTLHLSILTGQARTAYDRGIDRDLRVAAIGYSTFPKQLAALAADLAAISAHSESPRAF